MGNITIVLLIVIVLIVLLYNCYTMIIILYNITITYLIDRGNPASWWPIAVLAMSTGFHGKLALRRLQKLASAPAPTPAEKRKPTKGEPRVPIKAGKKAVGRTFKEDAKTLANEEDALEEDCFSQKHLRCLVLV